MKKIPKQGNLKKISKQGHLKKSKAGAPEKNSKVGASDLKPLFRPRSICACQGNANPSRDLDPFITQIHKKTVSLEQNIVFIYNFFVEMLARGELRSLWVGVLIAVPSGAGPI
jgi:hypothetical protein